MSVIETAGVTAPVPTSALTVFPASHVLARSPSHSPFFCLCRRYWGNTLYHVDDVPFRGLKVTGLPGREDARLPAFPQVFTHFRKATEGSAPVRDPLPIPPRFKASLSVGSRESQLLWNKASLLHLLGRPSPSPHPPPAPLLQPCPVPAEAPTVPPKMALAGAAPSPDGNTGEGKLPSLATLGVPDVAAQVAATLPGFCKLRVAGHADASELVQPLLRPSTHSSFYLLLFPLSTLQLAGRRCCLLAQLCHVQQRRRLRLRPVRRTAGSAMRKRWPCPPRTMLAV